MSTSGKREQNESRTSERPDVLGDHVKREDFIALCEQVLLIATELEFLDRRADPEGPNGWRLRKPTEIKNKLAEILGKRETT